MVFSLLAQPCSVREVFGTRTGWVVTRMVLRWSREQFSNRVPQSEYVAGRRRLFADRGLVHSSTFSLAQPLISLQP